MSKKRISKRKRLIQEKKAKKAANKIYHTKDKMDLRNERIDKARKNTANTRAFRTPLSFGPASDVRIIDPSTYKEEE